LAFYINIVTLLSTKRQYTVEQSKELHPVNY
jgi:hypothetical protein